MNEICINNILDINKGCARLFYGKASSGKYIFAIGVSDNKIDLDSIDLNEIRKLDDVKEYVFGIRLEDYRQAESYSIAFARMAKKMKEDQNGNKV